MHEKEGEGIFLTLRPISSGLETYTKKKWITFSYDGTLSALYSSMLERLKSDFPQFDIKSLREELIRKEKEYTSLIGHGISLPHTYTASIDKSILLVAKFIQPTICLNNNAETSIAFMVISPKGQQEAHLELISKIAKFTMKETTRQALNEATTVDELYYIIEKG